MKQKTQHTNYWEKWRTNEPIEKCLRILRSLIAGNLYLLIAWVLSTRDESKNERFRFTCSWSCWKLYLKQWTPFGNVAVAATAVDDIIFFYNGRFSKMCMIKPHYVLDYAYAFPSFCCAVVSCAHIFRSVYFRRIIIMAIVKHEVLFAGLVQADINQWYWIPYISVAMRRQLDMKCFWTRKWKTLQSNTCTRLWNSWSPQPEKMI